jgi:hypothetical protein
MPSGLVWCRPAKSRSRVGRRRFGRKPGAFSSHKIVPAKLPKPPHTITPTACTWFRQTDTKIQRGKQSSVQTRCGIGLAESVNQPLDGVEGRSSSVAGHCFAWLAITIHYYSHCAFRIYWGRSQGQVLAAQTSQRKTLKKGSGQPPLSKLVPVRIFGIAARDQEVWIINLYATRTLVVGKKFLALHPNGLA